MKVTQSCLTLCDPVDCSPPGTSVHGIIQARIWSKLPFPTPWDFPDPEIKPKSPDCRQILYSLSYNICKPIYIQNV